MMHIVSVLPEQSPQQAVLCTHIQGNHNDARLWTVSAHRAELPPPSTYP